MSVHDEVKKQILLTCNSLGFKAQAEYRGKDWRADIFVLANGVKYAFEIQTSRQSLNKTLERQDKYQRDGVIGCWLFEKEPAKLKEERKDLPLFHFNNLEGQINVSLKERKDLALDVFVNDYLQNKIKFCQTFRLPKAEIRFVKEECWKCGFEYYIYYIGNFISPCNAKIFEHEILWGADKMIFIPEIITKVNEYTKSVKEKNLNIGTIKERHSKTVGDSYLSFGCPECDAIYGDWFLHETIMGTIYEQDIDKILIEGNFNQCLETNIPHWCHTGEHKFCE